ncbi:DUF4351 domain-containing protein [Cronbergia sp. UHCC 0137]|uniref:DUF4351 domain-containing protein n=1 Tax=Cronbergia sp. UHCC 0137 TaxID=3110239 RepID=UPI002B213BD9|nr:DUF4351 domain-containing protein [Cronbergia sp. UHCC 0137]MEA5616937.1 DUF4351 domain-containing protein [Cronbergia sp. UHCC 0137]
MTFLVLMLIDMKQLMGLLGYPDFLFSKLQELFLAVHKIFLIQIPDKSIYSYLTTSVFSVIVFLCGNTLINYFKYNNQVEELKKILSSLIDNQVSSIQLIQYELIQIRLTYRIISRQQQAETEIKKNIVRNFWSKIARIKRTIVKVEKDNLYEKLLIDRKLLKAEPSIMVDDYFYTLRQLLINLETLVESDLPDSSKEKDFYSREVDLIYDILDRDITDLGVLMCQAEICKIVLLENKIFNIVWKENKENKKNKESLVNSFYKLISPNTSEFESPKREMIPPDYLEKIDNFINERCRKQKSKYCDFSELIQSTRTVILVIQHLTERLWFVQIPISTRANISRLPLPILENLSKALLYFNNLHDLENWLSTNQK